MNWFTVGWVVLGVAAAVLEGVALFNSQRNDTISEHLWAWLGIKTRKWKTLPDHTAKPITPTKTMWVARLVFFGFWAWFGLHVAGWA